MRYNISLKSGNTTAFFETFPKYLQIISLPLSPQLVTVSMYNIKAPTKRNIFVSINIVLSVLLLNFLKTVAGYGVSSRRHVTQMKEQLKAISL